MKLAVVVCTRDRIALLERALGSIEVARTRLARPVEVVAVDNGSSDSTPAVLARWANASPGRVHLEVPSPGKSIALNTYLRRTDADLVALTDDDVTVDPDWLAAIVRFFERDSRYAAAAGPIHVPPDVTDPELLERIRLYPTLPFWEIPAHVRLTQLLGANMVLTRRVFDAVGFFDERLGPGAAGLAEDTDMGERIIRAGLEIAYLPEAIVYHAVDESRLTLEALCAQERRQARSRFLLGREGDSVARLVLRLAEVSLAWVASTLVRDRGRAIRNRGKIARYAEMLRLAMGSSSDPGPRR